MKIVALTQGDQVPSTRFRWRQYAGNLQEAGFETTELASYFGAYPPASKIMRPAWLAATAVENLARVLRSKNHDLCLLQRNLTATLYTWESFLQKPFIFDVDDAIFLGPRGGSVDRIAKRAAITICGNNFLAEHFSSCGRVAILPTAVDTDYFVQKKKSIDDRPIIGWSGSSSGLQYLYDIESEILRLLDMHPQALLKVVCDRKPMFTMLPQDRVIYEPWSPEREVAVLHEFSVGIMPLKDDLWARGKCSFKMLTYMAVGLPVVVSPVGMNQEILQYGNCGFPAKTPDDWVDAISALLTNVTLAEQMGKFGREIVEARYAKKVIAPELTRLLRGQL